ncbi:DUF2255 family protein [Actinoplanes sp. TFC3]|uniref:DUF2255 family protein n=1 Tax=Actinoplanes sp. TFC3 TaxID=1710355 RepID=UPI000835C8E9|nr:DUF2255 family protein [Actinoplanes sp. TFC3]
MDATWTAEQLERLDAADELEIAVKRADATLRRWTPIWVVCAAGQVYVRTWHRRDTGWFGDAVSSGRARIRVPGVDADVLVHDVGAAAAGVDDAYRGKYARYGPASLDPMVSPGAVATTLRLDPDMSPS